MQLSSSFYQQLNNETDSYSSPELVPPPYHNEISQDECLPQYMDVPMELDGILDRFAPRYDNQRIQHDYYYCKNEKSTGSILLSPSTLTTFEKTNNVLDRMEDYRHNDQEWTSQNEMKRKQMVTNMYHIRHTPTSSCCTAKKQPSLSSSARSKYYKISLSIAKEREHIVHRMKKIRSPKTKSSSCKNEFDQFLNSIHNTSSQFEMTNQRATLIIPTI